MRSARGYWPEVQVQFWPHGVVRHGKGRLTATAPERFLDMWRDKGKGAGEEPHEEKDDASVDGEIENGIADQVAGADFENADEREHPEGIDQVGQSLGGVVDLHDPAEMDAQVASGLQDVGRFNDPFAAAGWHEKTEYGGIDGDKNGKSAVRGDTEEKAGEVAREPRHGDDSQNSAIKRELNEHAGGGGNGAVDGAGKGARGPMQEQAGHKKQQVVGIEVESGERAASDDYLRDVGKADNSDGKREKRSGFEPISQPTVFHGGFRNVCGREITRDTEKARGLGGKRGSGPVGDEESRGDQDRRRGDALPGVDRLAQGNCAADFQQRGWERRRRGHQQRGGGRKTESPNCA